jgi:hypothetical protein
VRARPASLPYARFRLGGGKRLQFENAEGASIAPEKAQDNRTAFEKTRKVDEAAALAQPEPRRDLAGLHGLGDKTCFGERLGRVTLRGRVRVSASEGFREGVLAGFGLAIGSE